MPAELDLREENECDGGKHERNDKLEGGRGLCRANQTSTEEVGGEDDGDVDEWHKGGALNNSSVRDAR